MLDPSIVRGMPSSYSPPRPDIDVDAVAWLLRAGFGRGLAARTAMVPKATAHRWAARLLRKSKADARRRRK